MSTEIQKQQSEELQNYSITNAKQMLSLASDLTKFIRENKLTSNIKGKEFVNVEAWTFAGMSMGLTPIVQTVDNISTEGEIKYRATVDIVNLHTGALVSRGFAICSNKESTKRTFDEYAIASMAQTRATGKGYRLPLGWLIKAAGFEPCPSEEMDTVKEQEEERNRALVEFISSPSREAIDTVWKKYPQHRKDVLFQTAAKAMAALYPKEEVQEAEVVEDIKFASEKQKGLISNLLNSHHIPESYRSHVVDIETNYEGNIPLADFELIYQDLQDMIMKGGEHEKTTPAEEEQLDTIDMLSENTALKPEETEKWKVWLKKPHTIAQANAAIKKLEETIQERSKSLVRG